MLGHIRDCRRNGRGPVAGHAGFAAPFTPITGRYLPGSGSAGDRAATVRFATWRATPKKRGGRRVAAECGCQPPRKLHMTRSGAAVRTARRRLAEPDLEFRAFCARKGLPASLTLQLERAWDAWQAERYRRGETSQRPGYTGNQCPLRVIAAHDWPAWRGPSWPGGPGCFCPRRVCGHPRGGGRRYVAGCRELTWAAMERRGVLRDDPRSWPSLVEDLSDLAGEPFVAAYMAPALTAAYDELIGPGRWEPSADIGQSVVVRFPAEDERANAGYHIEGSYAAPDGSSAGWVNIRSRARGLLALFLFTDVGRTDLARQAPDMTSARPRDHAQPAAHQGTPAGGHPAVPVRRDPRGPHPRGGEPGPSRWCWRQRWGEWPAASAARRPAATAACGTSATRPSTSNCGVETHCGSWDCW